MIGHEPETLSTVPMAPAIVRDWRGSSPRPVFVHSSFRTSSTWLWERFRRSPETTAYYEIFHEALADLTPSQVMGNHHAAWESKHPAQAPYFIEFLNLLQKDKGVPAYDADMAFRSFIPSEGFDGALTSGEKSYISRLIRNATDNHKTPVLTCTRSAGRARAIARSFPGCHILLFRRLFDQWGSYSYQSLIGNSYFFDRMNDIIDYSDDLFLLNIKECFPLSTIDVKSVNLFYRFSFFHLYIYAHAFDSCDIILDASACRDPDYQATMEERIRQSTSLTIDLSGARRNFELSLLSVGDRALFVDTIRQFTKIICGGAPSPESADFVRGLAEQLLDDWDKNEFHTHRIRTSYIERLNDLAAIESDRTILIETQAQSLAAASAREALTAELAAVQDTLEDSRREATEKQAHLANDLARARETIEGLRDELTEARAAASARDALTAELAAVQDTLEDSRREATEKQAHLANDLARARETIEGLRDELTEARAAASARDALTAELAAVQDTLEDSRREATEKQAHLANDLARARETIEGLRDELTESRAELDALSNEKADLSLETTSLRAEADASTMRIESLQQSQQAIQARLKEQASEILLMGTELNAAAARNTLLDRRLQIARATPPTLMRRLARLKRRILKP
ncbi:hypothetical protein [Brevundimonas fontaquae]|uniref:Chromosome partition protein Smc n=1 Tax=Brevundimonas fontaquae TaxID=2813778 RepID=A0ABX7LUK5_9CAUL|nr:hypothetical protein [Brevundimonas fontaquae]QSF55380.1 hypothetical protein JX001_06180 [Brevundimonas fontaquae]